MSHWHFKFIDLAKHIAEWSKDINRKNGAVIVDTDNNVLSLGYNGFPRGCDDSVKERYEQPTKYLYTEHAERNAIYHAARNGVIIKNAKMYMTMFCCADCARAIIQSGITEIIAPEPDLTHAKWGEHFKSAIEMLKEANVRINTY